MFRRIGTTCRVMPSTRIKNRRFESHRIIINLSKFDVADTYQKRSGNSDFKVAQ